MLLPHFLLNPVHFVLSTVEGSYSVIINMNFIRYFLTLLMFSVAAGSLFQASSSTSFPSLLLLLRHIRYKIFIQVLHPTHYIIIKGFVFLK